MNLGRWFFLFVIFGILCAIACAPGEEPAQASDNTACRFDGYQENAVRGHLRTSFDYEGGECRCNCEGIGVDLICEVRPEGVQQ